MTDYTKLVAALRHCVSDEKGVTKCAGCPYYPDITGCIDRLHTDAAAAIEDLQAEVKRLQDKLCDWCAVCPKERRKPEDCELIGENPVMYGPSGTKMEAQDG